MRYEGLAQHLVDAHRDATLAEQAEGVRLNPSDGVRRRAGVLLTNAAYTPGPVTAMADLATRAGVVTRVAVAGTHVYADDLAVPPGLWADTAERLQAYGTTWVPAIGVVGTTLLLADWSRATWPGSEAAWNGLANRWSFRISSSVYHAPFEGAWLPLSAPTGLAPLWTTGVIDRPVPRLAQPWVGRCAFGAAWCDTSVTAFRIVRGDGSWYDAPEHEAYRLPWTATVLQPVRGGAHPTFTLFVRRWVPPYTAYTDSVTMLTGSGPESPQLDVIHCGDDIAYAWPRKHGAGALWRSTDDGVTWAPMSLPASVFYNGSSYQNLWYDHAARMLLLGTYDPPGVLAIHAPSGAIAGFVTLAASSAPVSLAAVPGRWWASAPLLSRYVAGSWGTSGLAVGAEYPSAAHLPPSVATWAAPPW